MVKDCDVLVVGDINVDLLLNGPNTIPEFGQREKLLDDATLTVGGSSAICACGLARLGLQVAFIGKVGDDTFGHFLVDELSARGIDTSGIKIDPNLKTGLTVVFKQGTDRALLTYPGSIGALRFDDIPILRLMHARHLHVGGYFLLNALRPNIPQLFEAAHNHGVTVSLDPNYDPCEMWDGGLQSTLNYVDVFLPNEVELRSITRVEDVRAALELPGLPTTAVKLGAKGSIAKCLAEWAQVEATPIEVRDTTGAGDSFDAGFIYGYLAGWDLARTLRLAVACGSISTQAVGGTNAQPTLQEAIACL
jgi:sugar/nucleoside kinase (ribokinase family)